MKAPQALPLTVAPLSQEIRASADRALTQAFAMHEAAVVLQAAEAFEAWAKEHPGMYSMTEVVSFLMGYGRRMIDDRQAQDTATPDPLASSHEHD